MLFYKWSQLASLSLADSDILSSLWPVYHEFMCLTCRYGRPSLTLLRITPAASVQLWSGTALPLCCFFLLPGLRFIHWGSWSFDDIKERQSGLQFVKLEWPIAQTWECTQEFFPLMSIGHPGHLFRMPGVPITCAQLYHSITCSQAIFHLSRKQPSSLQLFFCLMWQLLSTYTCATLWTNDIASSRSLPTLDAD